MKMREVMDFQLLVADDPDGLTVTRHSAVEREKSERLDEDTASKKLIVDTRRETGILPPVVRYISGTGRHILLERPPQVVELNYYGKPLSEVDKATKQTMDLPLPWTVYAIGLDDRYRPYFVYVFGAMHSIQTEFDMLFALPLPNCEPNGKFCRPSPLAEKQNDILSVAEGINTAYASIWDSNFNTDITSNIVNAYRRRQPSAIFEGKGNRRPMARNAHHKPSNLFKRWEEFSLEEIAQWNDWTPAAWPDANPLLVHHVMYMLRDADGLYNPRFMYNSIRQRLM